MLYQLVRSFDPPSFLRDTHTKKKERRAGWDQYLEEAFPVQCRGIEDGEIPIAVGVVVQKVAASNGVMEMVLLPVVIPFALVQTHWKKRDKKKKKDENE